MSALLSFGFSYRYIILLLLNNETQRYTHIRSYRNFMCMKYLIHIEECRKEFSIDANGIWISV